jgi:acyl dehydratase
MSSVEFRLLGQPLNVGDNIPPWEMSSVCPERMRTMAAILRDPNPLHWDRKAVAALPLDLGERTINQGPLGLSYMINMLHQWAGQESIKRFKMTFPQVVLDGDCVIAKGTINALRLLDATTGNAKRKAVADCDIWLEHAERGSLLIGSATVLIDPAS